MKVVITGAHGFIGTHLQRALQAAGHEIKLARRLGLHENTWKADFVGATAVVHLACEGVPSEAEHDPAKHLSENLRLARCALEASQANHVQKFIFSSSGGTVYGPSDRPLREADSCRPYGAYGKAKLAVEELLRKGLRGRAHLSVARIANAYGLRKSLAKPQGVIEHFLAQLQHASTVDVWGDGSQARDFIHVEDACSGIERILAATDAPPIVNLGTGVAYSVNSVVATMGLVLGRRIECRYRPSSGSGLAYSALDPRLALATLGWRPTISLQEGIRRTARDMGILLEG